MLYHKCIFDSMVIEYIIWWLMWSCLFSWLYVPSSCEHINKVHPYTIDACYVKRPDRRFTICTNGSGYHNVSSMCKRISVVMLFASVSYLIILVINVGRFPWLGSCSWPLSSQLLFLWMLPWALMDKNSYWTENSHGKKAGGRKGETEVIVLGFRMVLWLRNSYGAVSLYDTEIFSMYTATMNGRRKQ